MSTAPAASTPALRKLHGSPTWLGSSAMNGAGDGVPGSGWPTVVWRRNATPARRRAANVASSSGGGGGDVAEGLDADPDRDGRVVLGRVLAQEVAAHDDHPGVGVELHPVRAGSAGFSALNTISYEPSGPKVNWLSLMSASTRPLNPPSTASECTVKEM